MAQDKCEKHMKWAKYIDDLPERAWKLFTVHFWKADNQLNQIGWLSEINSSL